ncbi:hypothetical protein [Helicobacter pametensis]|uniref:hypothetical protein n=1 Tax=Helicobacter pametensis TaxID=95149 RepID=UPI00048501C3|nr:hypothetical protein [Helicobacter pametensis]
MTTDKLQATIKTKDGVRVFNLGLTHVSQPTQDTLKNFFTQKDYVSLEELLSFCITQTEKISQLQGQNKLLRDESQKLQQEIEKLCAKLESL